jgi:15-cis-phytoene synthase
MMLPVLQRVSRQRSHPRGPSGWRFSTNFPRDLDEDLHRGWVYMPQDDLRLFDVEADDLASAGRRYELRKRDQFPG